MRRLDPEEGARRVAAGKAGPQYPGMAGQPASPELEQAIERARAALLLVVRDIESTTSIRRTAGIQRYDDWVRESAQSPRSWVIDGIDEGDEAAVVEEEGLALVCHFDGQFDGHSFIVDGDQSIAETAAGIAFQLQDDVMDEVWGAWPKCPQHAHPLSSEVVSGIAIWACPRDASSSVPIGQLGGIGH